MLTWWDTSFTKFEFNWFIIGLNLCTLSILLFGIDALLFTWILIKIWEKRYRGSAIEAKGTDTSGSQLQKSAHDGNSCWYLIIILISRKRKCSGKVTFEKVVMLCIMFSWIASSSIHRNDHQVLYNQHNGFWYGPWEQNQWYTVKLRHCLQNNCSTLIIAETLGKSLKKQMKRSFHLCHC